MAKLNYGETKYTNLEEGMQELRDKVAIRNQMGGALYFNILNDDCCTIANDLLYNFDGNYNDIAEIVGRENFR